MSFDGEFASYEPLRRLKSSEKVAKLESRFRLRTGAKDEQEQIEKSLIDAQNLKQSDIKPEYVIAIDGSNLTVKAQNGFPCAEYSYITIASVLIDLLKVKKLASEEFIDPKEFRKTETAAPFDTAIPGCNIILDGEIDAKASMRRVLYEELSSRKSFESGETLLETYEYLFQLKITSSPSENLPKSPIEEVEDTDMLYGMGEYQCPHTGQALFSTDALRLHELFNPNGTCGEMFGQIRATFEKLWLVNILRGFEKLNWLHDLRNVAFVIDGPLAVFSTSSWLTKVIQLEMKRINEAQKSINNNDMMIFGIEKSGGFFNHFEEIDTQSDGIVGKIPNQSLFLIDDEYIKKNIIFSTSKKPYGLDTYFGRKCFYKTKSGQRLVPVICSFDDNQKDLSTAKIDQFPRIADIAALLDDLSSNRYPNSISPLISAHAEAAIPLNLGTKIFEDMARKLREGH